MMKKSNYFTLIFTICCLILITVSMGIGSVSARWFYGPSGPVSNVNQHHTIGSLIWVGAEDLPNDESSGTAHKNLINNILNGEIQENDGTVVGVGLNTQNSYLAEVVKDRKGIWWRDADTLGSMDIWENDTINDYFDLNETTNAVSFILVFPDGSENTYYLYTTSVDLGGRSSPNIPIGTNVYPIYRTTITKNANGLWIATETKKGYAPSAYYANPILGLAIDPAFNTDKWTEGELGTSRNNAVSTYIGQTVEHSTESANNTVYYLVKASSATNIRVSVINGDNCTITVLNSNGNKATLTAGSQGSQSATFAAKANTNYYVAVTGETEAKFTIKKV